MRIKIWSIANGFSEGLKRPIYLAGFQVGCVEMGTWIVPTGHWCDGFAVGGVIRFLMLSSAEVYWCLGWERRAGLASLWLVCMVLGWGRGQLDRVWGVV